MTVFPSHSTNEATQHARLQQFLSWLIPIIFGFAALEGAAFGIFRDWASGITSLVMIGYGCGLLVANRQLRHFSLQQAVTTIWSGLFVAAGMIVLVQPALFPTLVATPLLVVAIALPYVSSRTLRQLIVVCWLVTIFIASAGLLLPRPSSLPTWFSLLFGITSLGAAVAMVLLLLWQFSTRLHETLAQTRASNVELRAAHAALEAQNDYLTVTLYSIADGVITADTDGNVQSLNRAAEVLTGWSQAEAVGTRLATVCHLIDESTAKPIEQPLKTLLSRGTANSVVNHATLVARNGATHAISASAALLHDRERQVIGSVLVCHDLTAYKRATEERMLIERKLLETQKLESLGVLAGGIAHDFNNLLTAVLGHASLAMSDIPFDHPARESIEQIEQGGLQAARLTEQLLAYAGRGRFVVEPLDLNSVIVKTKALLHTSISKRIRLQIELNPDLPLITADAAQIRQILMNLVMNAAEAIIDRDGTVTVQTWYQQHVPAAGEQTERYAAVSVTDSGHGMDRATQAKIFEPFYTTKFTGRGLGLAAVQGIVRSHGGHIELESAVGQGTTITVFLPIATEQPNRKQLPVAPLPLRSQRIIQDDVSETTILVVDDEDSVRSVTTRLLQHLGHRVLGATDGLEAVAILASRVGEIDGVLLDMTMPGMDGIATLQVCQRIAPHIPVVLMSGYTAEEFLVRFAEHEFAGFLHKPFTLDDLRTACRAITEAGVQASL